MNTTEQALNSWNLHSHCLTLRQLCEVGINAPVLQMRKPGLHDVKKMSLGHTFVNPHVPLGMNTGLPSQRESVS